LQVQILLSAPTFLGKLRAHHAPALLHAHYRGLCIKAKTEEWFAVAPAKADNMIPMATEIHSGHA
jgi:hypothetical protein